MASASSATSSIHSRYTVPWEELRQNPEAFAQNEDVIVLERAHYRGNIGTVFRLFPILGLKLLIVCDNDDPSSFYDEMKSKNPDEWGGKTFVKDTLRYAMVAKREKAVGAQKKADAGEEADGPERDARREGESPAAYPKLCFAKGVRTTEVLSLFSARSYPTVACECEDEFAELGLEKGSVYSSVYEAHVMRERTPILLLFGGESTGISRDAIRACAKGAFLPSRLPLREQTGDELTHSMNLSMSCAFILGERHRWRVLQLPGAGD
jgi:hypothetical protein